jgi:uncharacterized membrane protein required for colicin V production
MGLLAGWLTAPLLTSPGAGLLGGAGVPSALVACWRDPLNARGSQVLMVIMVALIVLSAVNALLITWATAIDARRSAALTRALGATPGLVTAGLAVAQMLLSPPGELPPLLR